MTASELFRAGRLKDALDAQLQDVKANPADQNRRLFLFELSAYSGDLERARRQIDLIHYDQPDLEGAVGLYRQCLDAEQARRAFFAGGPKPQLLGPAPEHLSQRLEALVQLRSSQTATAVQLLLQANEAPISLKGTINGQPFDGLRDGDDLFGTVLEVFSQGRYFWVPLEQIDSLHANAPHFPRDLLWFPARMVTRGGQSGDVFLPALYPASHEHPDDAIKLGRGTDWPSPVEGIVKGIGGRTLLAGENALGLPEIRELLFTTE
jgi:type VI secretion system protein ImpE